MELGQATPTKAFECKDRKKVVHKVYDNERHNVLAKVLQFANQDIFIGGINVRIVEKEDDTLQFVKNFTAPTNKYFVKGWAYYNTNKQQCVLKNKDQVESYFDEVKDVLLTR